MHKKISRYFGWILWQRLRRFVAYLAAFFFLSTVLWMHRRFGELSVEQFLFHFQFGAEGLEGYDASLGINYAKLCLLGTFFASCLCVWFEVEGERFWARTKRVHLCGWCRAVLFRGGPWCVAFFAFCFVGIKFGIADYATSAPASDYIKVHYVDPRGLSITAEHPHNLILIYVESLEQSYAQREIFGTNFLEPLDRLGGKIFPVFTQVSGSGWTMAGIISSQCSLPLKAVALANGNLQGEIAKYFLPRAVCLGDTLQSFGYQNVFLGGASLQFSGKGKFFSLHGYQKRMGKEEWLETGRYREEDMNEWGLYDEDLFTEARVELDQLVQKKKPFNLTLLTVNTHFPNGFSSPRCRQTEGKSFEAALRCSLSEITNFVKYAEGKGYLAHTRVVIMGDHLSMPNAVYDKLTKIPERQIYNQWLGGATPLTSDREAMIHLDVAPTILEFLGFRVKGGQYGLGYSAVGQKNPLSMKARIDELQTHLVESSDFYQQLWLPLE